MASVEVFKLVLHDCFKQCLALLENALSGTEALRTARTLGWGNSGQGSGVGNTRKKEQTGAQEKQCGMETRSWQHSQGPAN